MKYNQSVLNNYVPEFHLVAKEIFCRDKSMNAGTFKRKMRERFAGNKRLAKWFNQVQDMGSKMQQLYEDLRRIHKVDSD